MLLHTLTLNDIDREISIPIYCFSLNKYAMIERREMLEDSRRGDVTGGLLSIVQRFRAT